MVTVGPPTDPNNGDDGTKHSGRANVVDAHCCSSAAMVTLMVASPYVAHLNEEATYTCSTPLRLARFHTGGSMRCSAYRR